MQPRHENALRAATRRVTLPESIVCAERALKMLMKHARARCLGDELGAPGRVELPTNGLGNRCSIHLSYGADDDVTTRYHLILPFHARSQKGEFAVRYGVPEAQSRNLVLGFLCPGLHCCRSREIYI